jgi:hypothetical protein
VRTAEISRQYFIAVLPQAAAGKLLAHNTACVRIRHTGSLPRPFFQKSVSVNRRNSVLCKHLIMQLCPITLMTRKLVFGELQIQRLI